MYDLPVARVGRIIRPHDGSDSFSARRETARELLECARSYTASVQKEDPLSAFDVAALPSGLGELEAVSPGGVSFRGQRALDALVDAQPESSLNDYNLVVHLPSAIAATESLEIELHVGVLLCGGGRQVKVWTSAMLTRFHDEPARSLDADDVRRRLESLKAVAEQVTACAEKCYCRTAHVDIPTPPQSVVLRVVNSSAPNLHALFGVLGAETAGGMSDLLGDERNRSTLDGFLHLSSLTPDEEVDWYMHETSDYSVLYFMRGDDHDAELWGLGVRHHHCATESPALESSRIVAEDATSET